MWPSTTPNPLSSFIVETDTKYKTLFSYLKLSCVAYKTVYHVFPSLTDSLLCILTPLGNRLPVWRAPSPAVTGTWPGHHGRACVAVFLQGGAVLCGDCGVHLLRFSGPRLLIIKPPRNRPLPLRTAGGPGWLGGGHSAPYLCYQYQPANGARERTLCKCCNLTRSNGEFTVDRCRSCLTSTFIGFLPSG